MKLSNPQYLYLWALIPVFFFLHYLYIKKKKKQLNEFADLQTLEVIIPELSIGKHYFKFIFWNCAYFFLILSLSNPQIGTTIKKKERKGTDIIVCLDISNSMYAQDIKPNRLMRAKQSLTQLISQLQNDRIGLVVFAGSAFVQLPITNDYGAAKIFIDIVEPSMIENQGTAIGEALLTAQEAFGEEKGKKSNKSKSIILISDGEDNESGAIEIAKEVAQNGIVINTIGLGSTEGAAIPIVESNEMGTRKDFKRDSQGQVVMTKLNEDILKSIAKQGNGTYIAANNETIGLDNILAKINNMDKNQYEAVAYKDYDDRFHVFAFIALLFVIAEFLIFEHKNKYINRKFFFGK
jgi:Ca-activated chloride channel family protein